MQQNPLSNFLLRPRSTQHRHRRSCSSPSSLAAAIPLSPTSTPSLIAPADDHVLVANVIAHPPLITSHSCEHRIINADNNVPDQSTVPINVSQQTTIHEGIIPSHRHSCESPFPSPYSLNVPLSSSSAYLCTLTLPEDASSLSLSSGLLYTGLHSGDILVRKTPKLPECARFGIGNLPVQALLVTDNIIFTAHKDHKIQLWHRPDAEGDSYCLMQTLPTAIDYLRNIILSKRYIQIRRHHRRLWIQHVDTITAMAVDSTSQLLFSASWDKTFKVWNLRNMRCVQSVKAHDDAINAIVVSSQADGFIYTGSADGTIKVWKKLSAQKIVQVTTLGGRGASVNTMVMKADMGILYSGGSNCCISVWQRVARDRLAWKLIMMLRGHRLPVLCLAASGPLVCSGGADKMVRVWRRGVLGSYTCLAILQGHSGPVKSIAIAVSTLRSCFVYSASLDATTKVWSVLFEKEDDEESNTNMLGN